MKATISLDGIWNFLQSLSLSASNKEWLGEKLLEEARKEKIEKKESYEDFIWSMCGAWNEDPRTTEKIIEDIRNSQ
ncbi:hypothetical protein [uncultured Parabacteroides sp.]|jgi:hypothetical protein|uniref:hypothetical protein n=1 Tax=uncultured Parabacteroides sp. TaxID=512312 RepID=UPI0025CFA68B|nr:hypothetical protein [uncultured Parabacteroides sp.]